MNADLRMGPAAVLLMLAACSGRVEDEPRTPDGTPTSTTPTTPTTPTAPGTSTAKGLSLESVSELEFSRASLGGAHAAGDACQELELSVRLVRATRDATWSSCRGTAGSRALVTGARVLTAEEAALFEAHVQAATYGEADRKNCSYDGTLFAMNAITASGAQLYVHDNINCYTDGRRVAPEVRDLTSELWVTASGTPLP